MITFVFVFDADQNYSLAQCISSDKKFGMFRGISILFLKHYLMLQTLRDNSLESDKLGTLVPLKVWNKYIYNLLTNPLYWMKPTLSWLFSALQSMREHAVVNGVTNIAAPLLGSGCDKLNFPILKQVFDNQPVDLAIYYLEHSKDLLANMGFVRYVEIIINH